MISGSSRPEFDGWFVEPGPYPVRTGNTVRPLIDGEPAFRRICEAIEAARFGVWMTVTFLWDDFEMPDGHGSFFDVLGRAATRGLDVRVIFWRPGEERAQLRKNAFWGSAGHLAQLDAAGSRILARWDRSPSGVLPAPEELAHRRGPCWSGGDRRRHQPEPPFHGRSRPPRSRA